MKRVILLIGLLVALCRAGACVGPPARQLHDQPVQPHPAVRRSRLRAVRPRHGRDPDLPGKGRASTARVRRPTGPRSRTAIGANLTLTVGGQRLELSELDHALAFPKGAGGLDTTRLEIVFESAPVPGGGGTLVLLRTETTAERLGWKEIVIAAGRRCAGRCAERRLDLGERRAPRLSAGSAEEPARMSRRRLPTSRPGQPPGSPPPIDGRQLEAPARVNSQTESGFAEPDLEGEPERRRDRRLARSSRCSGARPTRSARATARRSSPRTSSERVVPLATPSTWAGSSRSRTRSASSRSG